MKGKVCKWLLVLVAGIALVLPACGQNQAQGKEPGREVKEITLTEETKNLNQDFEPKKLNIHKASLGKLQPTYSGGYLDGKTHVFMNLENTSMGQYSDKGQVVMEEEDKSQDIFTMDQAPAEINELYGDKAHISWVASDGDSTSLYLYDINSKETEVIESYPQGHQGILNSMGKDQVLWRKGNSILSYNFKTKETEALADDVREESSHIRPEISGQTLAYETKDGITCLNLEDKTRVNYKVAKPSEIQVVKASPNYLVWGTKKHQNEGLWVYNRKEDQTYKLATDQPISSYHLSQSILGITLNNKILVLDLDKGLRDVYELKDGETADYGRVMTDGTLEFALQGEGLAYLLINPN